MSFAEPAFPTPHQYAPYFCEENAYQLVRLLPQDGQGQGFVVVVTNHTQSVAAFFQRASRLPLKEGAYAVWDYHVVVVHNGWVYDADSLLCLGAGSSPASAPGSGTSSGSRPSFDAGSGVSASSGSDLNLSLHAVEASTYFRATFPLPRGHALAPAFRVVGATDYVQHFASDRRHMLSSTGDATQRFPPWAAVRGVRAREHHNLPLWLDLTYTGDGFGCVVTDCDALVRLLEAEAGAGAGAENREIAG